MLTREQMLLIKLQEECDEVGQRAMKALQFGLEEVQIGHLSNNRQRLTQEYTDLLAIGEMLMEARGIVDLRLFDLTKAIKQKREKVEKYFLYSQQLGIMEPDK